MWTQPFHYSYKGIKSKYFINTADKSVQWHWGEKPPTCVMSGTRAQEGPTHLIPGLTEVVDKARSLTNGLHPPRCTHQDLEGHVLSQGSGLLAFLAIFPAPAPVPVTCTGTALPACPGPCPLPPSPCRRQGHLQSSGICPGSRVSSGGRNPGMGLRGLQK